MYKKCLTKPVQVRHYLLSVFIWHIHWRIQGGGGGADGQEVLNPLGKSQVAIGFLKTILIWSPLEKQFDPLVQLLLEGGLYVPLINT